MSAKLNVIQLMDCSVQKQQSFLGNFAYKSK